MERHEQVSISAQSHTDEVYFCFDLGLRYKELILAAGARSDWEMFF